MKKFFSLVLALVMALSLMTVAWGADVATEADLTTAVGNGGEIKLMADIPVSSRITVAKDVTLDLNGYTVSGTCNASQDCLFYINNGVTMTIKDSSTAQTGKVTYAAGTSNVGWTFDVEGALVLESGTLELTGDWSIGYVVDVRPNAWGTPYTYPTTFTMNGGKVVSSDGGVRVASSSSETHTDVSANFVMNAGEIDAAWDGIFIQQSNGVYDILNVTINDGTITSDKYAVRVYGPAATGSVGNVATPTNVSLDGGDYTGTVTVTNTFTTDSMDFEISGGTFAVAPPAEYVADGLRYDSATGELTTMPTTGVGKYDLYDANGDIIEENITVECVEAYDDEGAGNIEYYKLTWDGVTYAYFVECSRTKADCYLTLADNLGAYKHLKHVDYVDYVATGKAYTNIGDDCGELDVSAKAKAYVVTDEDGVSTYYVANAAGRVVIKVGNELVAVDVVADGLVPHVWVVTAYNDDAEPITAKCKNCPATGKLYATKLAAPIGSTFDATQVAGYWVVVNGSASTTTDKVESAETFDAGIAMYVGMSVMAAAGSVVVLKKRED